MCGIAGLIHRGNTSNVGYELQGMLQALKHRGEDSTGYALYGKTDGQNFIMRFKVGENVGEGSSSVMEDVSVYDERKKIVDSYLSELGAKIVKEERILPYSLRYEIQYDKDLMEFSQKIESVPGVEILSMGKSLEVIKDLGNAEAVCKRYNLDKLVGTHAIGHARMATESGVDIKSAHPFWGYPFSDVSVAWCMNQRILEGSLGKFVQESFLQPLPQLLLPLQFLLLFLQWQFHHQRNHVFRRYQHLVGIHLLCIFSKVHLLVLEVYLCARYEIHCMIGLSWCSPK